MPHTRKRFRIEGQVIDRETSKGVADLLVEIWDNDFFYDDLVGKTETDESGKFEMEFDESYFREIFFDRLPDLYFKIFCDDMLIADTTHQTIWNVKPGTTRVKLKVEVPERKRPTKVECPCRNIYLKIEKIPAYSPAEPSAEEHGIYRKDCFRNEGHENGLLPDNQVELLRLDAVVYREYTDDTYLTLVDTPLIDADVTEPHAEFRVPGTVIYTRPGERLCIHVKNCDDAPHSLHVHGLAYGVDSDGAWPLGVNSTDGRRSDEILPGDSWTYEFEVRDDMIGAWPFHDHHRKTRGFVNRGLFGGIVVRDPNKPCPDYEVPFFLHRMAGSRTTSAFDSGTLTSGSTFMYTFPLAGTFTYFCRFHNGMVGTVIVANGEPANESVNIVAGAFDPPTIRIRPGGTVTWTNSDTDDHTVTEQSGAGGQESFAINGRVYAGNTPIIEVESGKRIRWYVFNLDFGMDWHNFHTHAQRWKWADEYVDTRSLGPAESFVADTIAPEVLLPPCNKPRKGEKLKKYKLCANYPVHCHVEPHMMQGMIALVRAKQVMQLSNSQLKALGFDLPDPCKPHECPEIDVDRGKKAGTGEWSPLPDSPIFVVHAAVLNSGKVLLFSGKAEIYSPPATNFYPLESRLWNPETNTFSTQAVTENLFCSGHTFLADGNLLVGGGDRPTSGMDRIDSTHIFESVAETWNKLPASSDMQYPRWYPTLLTMSDGRILAASGAGSAARNGANKMEIFDPDPAALNWTEVAGGDKPFNGYYPSLHLLPSGHIFHSRTSWGFHPGTQAAYFTFSGTNSGFWTTAAAMEFPDRQEGFSLLLIDDSAASTTAKIYVIGGGQSGVKNPQSGEMIDVTNPTTNPPWQRIADMNYQRTNVNCVILPDGTILAIGGRRAGKFASDPQPVLAAEVYNPTDNSWAEGSAMQYPRQYHSIAVLLPDGRVLTAGGVHPFMGNPFQVPERDQRFMEVYSPPYLSKGPQPTITSAPATISYGTSFVIDSPDSSDINSVVLLRPMSVTHQTDAGQRYIKMEISGIIASNITAQAPANGNIAPPGDYMLFIVDSSGIPSVARFVRIA